MKILSRILSIALLLPALSVFVSCSEEQDGYIPAPQEKGAQVYFNSDNASSFTVTDVQNTFELSLGRVDTAETANYDLKVLADEATLPLFNIPGAVAFEEGEAFAKIACTANTTEMEYDKTYTVKVCVANAQDATLYGLDTLTISVTCPAPWKSLGIGKIADFFYSDKYFEVEIQRNELQPSMFRVVSPYDQIMEDAELTPNEGPSPYFEFEIVPAGSSLGSRTFPEEFVYFPPTRTGHYYDDGTYSGEVYAYHTAHFNSNLCSDEEVCFYNKVVAYQEVNGEVIPAQVFLAPLYYIPKDGVNFDKSTTKTEGMIDIIFPGYVPSDYSVDLSYSGIFTTPDGTVHAVGNLNLGSDATDVKAIVMPLDVDAAAVADAIAAGELEAMKVEAGRIEVPFNAEELGGNNFQIIVTVLADGAVKTVAVASFEYYGGGKSPWQSIGTGYYTDDILSSGWGLPPVTYEVEVLENNENPGLYRLVNPYNNKVYPAEYVQVFAEQLGNSLAPEGYNLEVNAMDVEGVYIQPQALGLDFGDGEWAFATMGGYYLANDYPFDMVKENRYLGSVVEGVIKFPVLGYEDQQGEVRAYQGVFYEGANGPYYSALNGKVEIVLPGANAFARNMAKAKANTTKRSAIKKSFFSAKDGLKFNRILNRTVETFATPNF